MICTILYNIVIGIIFYIISQQMLKGLIVEYHRQEYTEYNSAKCPLIAKILMIELYITPILGGILFTAFMAILLYGAFTEEHEGNEYTKYILDSNNKLHKVIEIVFYRIKSLFK